VALATVVCFALACGQARARKPAWAGFQVNSPALKNSAAGKPLFSMPGQANATIPPAKYALAKKQQGQKNRPQKA